MEHLAEEALTGTGQDALQTAIKNHLANCPDCQDHPMKYLSSGRPNCHPGMAHSKRPRQLRQIDMDQGLIKQIKTTSKLSLIAAGLLVACVPVETQTITVGTPAAKSTEEEIIGNPVPGTANSPSPITTPTEEPDFWDFVYLPMMPKDAIRPIYDPDFVTAIDSPVDDDELVIGVAIKGEAKAYPVSVLRFREMVDDELGGLPILVTW
jgi:hypothetical protein